MKYFTFIGTGNPNTTNNNGGYDEVSYRFVDGDTIVKTSFVQKAIVEKFKDEISEIYIFATEQAKEKNGDAIVNCLQGSDIKFIDIDKNISFEEFSSQLLSRINTNDEIIIDITHSFRHIPMKLLFALDYIEKAKDVNILHLYYGRLDGTNGLIEDIANDYRMRKISDLLAQFDRTLIIKTEDVEPYIVDSDELISKFLTSLVELNNVTELSQFTDCFNVITRVVSLCNKIIKEADRYQLLIPFVEKIKNKFADINSGNAVGSQITFVNILFKHRRFQVAITFTDQLFRKEICKFIYKTKVKTEDIYFYSQHCLALANIRGHISEKDKERARKDPVNIDNFKSLISKEDKKTIKSFFDDVRNNINHGCISKMIIEEMSEICFGVIAIVERMEENLNTVGKQYEK